MLKLLVIFLLPLLKIVINLCLKINNVTICNNIYKFYIHYVKAKDTIQSVEHLDGRLGPAAAAGSCFEGCSTRSAVKSCEGVWRCVGAGTETVGATAPFGAKCNQRTRHLHKCRLSLY